MCIWNLTHIHICIGNVLLALECWTIKALTLPLQFSGACTLQFSKLNRTLGMNCILHKSWTPKLIPIIVMILSSIVDISPGNAYKYLALGSLLSAQVQKNGTGLTVHYGTRRPSLSPHHGFNNGLHHQGPAPAAPPALNSAVFFLLRHVRPPRQRPPCRVRRKRETSSCDPSWVQCFCRKGQLSFEQNVNADDNH